MGSQTNLIPDPEAHAPGFMLPPASQARTATFVAHWPIPRFAEATEVSARKAKVEIASGGGYAMRDHFCQAKKRRVDVHPL